MWHRYKRHAARTAHSPSGACHSGKCPKAFCKATQQQQPKVQTGKARVDSLHDLNILRPGTASPERQRHSWQEASGKLCTYTFNNTRLSTTTSWLQIAESACYSHNSFVTTTNEDAKLDHNLAGWLYRFNHSDDLWIWACWCDRWLAAW